MRARDALERCIQRKSREPGEPTDARARTRATSPKLPRTCAVGGSTHAFNAFTNDRFNSTNRGPPVAGCGAASSTSMPWSVDIFEFNPITQSRAHALDDASHERVRARCDRIRCVCFTSARIATRDWTSTGARRRMTCVCELSPHCAARHGLHSAPDRRDVRAHPRGVARHTRPMHSWRRLRVLRRWIHARVRAKER